MVGPGSYTSRIAHRLSNFRRLRHSSDVYGPESATPGAFRLNSPSIRSRRRDDVPPLPLIATSPVEVLYGYPLDGVVLTTGCDKTTPAGLMAAASGTLRHTT